MMIASGTKNAFWGTVTLTVALMLASGTAASAMETTGEVGIGAFYTGVYTGSDDYYLTPVPVARISLDHKRTSVYLSVLEGFGIRAVMGQSRIFGEVSLNYGEERDSENYQVLGVEKSHSPRTRSFLLGTPSVTTDAVTKGSLGYLTRRGAIVWSVEYHPTHVDYLDDQLKDKDLDGFLYGLVYSMEGRIGSAVTLNGIIGLEYMNNDYAEAWYSNDQVTARLERFEAGGGLRSFLGALEVNRMFSENTGVKATLAARLLMGDAADSPYTRQRLQPTGMIHVYYAF